MQHTAKAVKDKEKPSQPNVVPMICTLDRHAFSEGVHKGRHRHAPG